MGERLIIGPGGAGEREPPQAGGLGGVYRGAIYDPDDEGRGNTSDKLSDNLSASAEALGIEKHVTVVTGTELEAELAPLRREFPMQEGPPKTDPPLKRCPFCGWDELDFNRTNERAAWVSCSACGSQAETGTTRQAAIKHWNRRVASEEADAIFAWDNEGEASP